MLFPSKLFTYEESVISKFVPVLERIQSGSHDVRQLFIEMKDTISTTLEFMDIIDCLYTLGKIDIKNGREIVIC